MGFKKSYSLQIGLCVAIVIAMLSSCASSIPEKKLSKTVPVSSKVFPSLPKAATDDVALSTDKDKAAQLVTRGSIFQMQSRHPEAILEFQEALRFDSSASICYALAKSYRDIIKVEFAIEYALKAIEMDSMFLPAHELLGELYISKARFAEAEKTYEYLYAVKPTRKYVYMLGSVCEISNVSRAIEVYSAFLEEDDDELLLNRLANLLAKSKNIEDYIHVVKRLFSYSSENAQAAKALIEYHCERREFDEAYTIVNKVFSSTESEDIEECSILFAVGLLADTSKSSARDSITRLFIAKQDTVLRFSSGIQELSGYLTLRLGDTSKAKSHFVKAIKRSDTPSVPLLRIGSHFLQERDYKSVVSLLTPWVDSVSAEPRIPFIIGLAWSQMDSLQNAIWWYRRCVGIDATFEDALFQLGYSYSKIEQYDSSDFFYERAIAVDSTNALALNNYAYSLATRKSQLERAKLLSEKSLMLDSTSSSFLDTYAWILFELGDYSTALQYAIKAINNSSASATVFEHLGDIYHKLGKTEEAVDAWRKALIIEPDRNSTKERLLFIK